MAESRVAQLKRELAALENDQEDVENELQDTRQARERLKARKRRGAVITSARIAAYTRKVKQLAIRLGNVNNGIASRERVLRRLEAEDADSPKGLAQTILTLAESGRVRFPLPLSTGGTAQRDFVQLASRGKVRTPATGEVGVPDADGMRLLRAIIRAGRNGGCDVNAYVGGIHRSASKHYRRLAFNGAENRANVKAAVRAEGCATFDEDPFHDHHYAGPGGP